MSMPLVMTAGLARFGLVGLVAQFQRAGPAPSSRRSRSARSRHRVEDGRGGVDVQRVAELVGLGRAAGFHAGGEVAGVVPARAAVAERPEQVAQRLEAEEVERLVGHLELHLLRLAFTGAAALLPPLPLGLEIGGAR